MAHRCPGYPYLGPIPPPSLGLGRALCVGSAGIAALSFVSAAFDVQRAGLDRRWADGQDVYSALNRNASSVSTLSIVVLLAGVAFIVVDLVWRRQRRPKATLQQWGEACVESPLRSAVPLPVRLAAIAPLLLWLVGLWYGSIPATAVPADYASHRMWLAVAHVGLGLAFLMLVVLFVSSERHVRGRIGRSQAAREAPWTVGYIPPSPSWRLGGDPRLMDPTERRPWP
jgi:hypothetical protein